MGLNQGQQAAVNAEQSALVVAIPGSGKSHLSIAYAIKQITSNDNSSILMISFTRAAADSLKERLKANLLPHQKRRVDATTFHSLAIKVWKKYNKPRRLILGVDTYVYIERAASIYNADEPEELLGLEEAMLLIDRFGQVKATAELSEYLKFWTVYCDLLKKEKVIDLSVIMREVVDGMVNSSIPTLSTLYGVTHMVIDEFQDCDPLQLEFVLQQHGGTHLFACGDDDQAIYKFRNSLGNQAFTRFENRSKAEVFYLSECYRCSQGILDAANEIININTFRYEKTLHSALDHDGSVSLYEVDGDMYFCLTKLLKKSPTTKNHAVLARTNLEITLLEKRLLLEDVTDYQRLGGKALLDELDVKYFIKIMYTFVHKDKRLLTEIMSYFRYPEYMISRVNVALNNESFADIVQLIFENTANKDGQKLLQKLALELPSDTASPADLAKFHAELIPLICAFRETDKIRLLEIVSDIITDRFKGSKSIKKATSSLYQQIIRPMKKGTTSDDSLVISTLHASKGLEYSTVYIINVNEDTIPKKKDEDDNLDEEVRLFYVGMTRAEQELKILFSYKKPSMFIQYLEAWADYYTLQGKPEK
ncbi:ATP-dependent helicase (plasmid) [Vibrio sp. SS-MA-C1-2]|uniref:UvrD-helicase domain-containing protein n=1 Tax=Vibrio sp. SS-MA-C1-2 TaxID=2908646 RepID=UPI001F44B28E|nr:ATP-dependent helicase [Vibrio sp. SS-MA-C1-2]UJF20281.1 ATP-dependent helicase [Vibrio sp. SS-MA-C1-2]